MKLDDLNKYYNKFKFGEDIFHHLMQKQIKEILLISSIFDAYVLEQDSRLSEQIYGEYQQLNLMMAPRITTISFTDDISSILKRKKFDAVIVMMRVGVETPGMLCKKIRKYNADMPVLLLLNKKSYIELIEQRQEINFDHPSSIEFCHKIGLDYVSCSGPRVPIARLAVAHAALAD